MRMLVSLYKLVLLLSTYVHRSHNELTIDSPTWVVGDYFPGNGSSRHSIRNNVSSENISCYTKRNEGKLFNCRGTKHTDMAAKHVVYLRCVPKEDFRKRKNRWEDCTFFTIKFNKLQLFISLDSFWRNFLGIKVFKCPRYWILLAKLNLSLAIKLFLWQITWR